MGAKICHWTKKSSGYYTECEKYITLKLRAAVYCPYCGNLIEKDYGSSKQKKEYFRRYYLKNKKRINEYQKEYQRKKREKIVSGVG